MSDPIIEKYDALAPGYSAREYADPARYAERRADVTVRIGPEPPPHATVLDLACGDANMAEPLLARGLRYVGVDGSAAMLAEARARLGDRVPLELARIEEYEPDVPVDVTLCLRTFYQPADRRAFFRRVAGYTNVKFVFDFEPRVFDRAEIEEDLLASGFGRVWMRPFFLPQRVAVPTPVRSALIALEGAGPLARTALRVRGVWFCAAEPAMTASPARTRT
jgi:SAM-dependent methyltransferase